MRNIPVDTSALSFTVAGEAEPKIVDRATGEVKKDAEGRELYTLPLLPMPNDDRRNPVIMVTFPSTVFPQIQVGSKVRLAGLVCFFWKMDGRAGMGFRCEAVRPAADKAA
ncbi:hypothetical protein [Nonomuraea basaltis]|uniref:SCO3933 family regulatory protein n=1 Tax=Nonomuraea basaltis TaxID=2495887 RepID=UPI00110C6841|nr:hypothetical protein [Nonomuraea basaltis]TMR99974.1 hypothetical protein EJK15_04185 [Nonomuraea basaltis]